MAGAGYDTSLAASFAQANPFANNYSSNVLFSGASLYGGNASSSQKGAADATSTNRSPGTVNSSKADLGGDDDFLSRVANLSGGPQSSAGGNSNLLPIVSIALSLFLILKK